MPVPTASLAARLTEAVLAAGRRWEVYSATERFVPLSERIGPYLFLGFLLVVIPLFTFVTLTLVIQAVPSGRRGAAGKLTWLALLPFCWPLAVGLLGAYLIPVALGEWANAVEQEKNANLEAEWQARKDAAPDDPSIPPNPPSYTMPVGDCGKAVGLLWLLPAAGLFLGFVVDSLQYAFGTAYILVMVIWLFAGRSSAKVIRRAGVAGDVPVGEPIPSGEPAQPTEKTSAAAAPVEAAPEFRCRACGYEGDAPPPGPHGALICPSCDRIQVQ